jgi:hypothetical protein
MQGRSLRSYRKCLDPRWVERQLLRRPRRLRPPPGWNEVREEQENAVIQAGCINRMEVFDQAPKRVRDRANANGEQVIENWWEDRHFRW